MARRILVVPRPAIGEVIFSQIIYKTLKYEDVEIDVLAASRFHPLLKRMPEVRKAIYLGELTTKKSNVLSLVWSMLRTSLNLCGHYDQAIVVNGGRQATVIPWLARIPVRTGLGKRRFRMVNDVREFSKEYTNLLRKEISLGQPRGTPFVDYPSIGPFPKLLVDAENLEVCMARFGLKAVGRRQINKVNSRITGHGRMSFASCKQFSSEVPVLVLLSGSHYGRQVSKLWGHHNFAEIVDYYGARGWEIWILGSEEEYQIGQQIIRFTKVPVHNLCGKTELTDVIDLLSQADLVIGNDTGLMHIAAAVGCSIVVIMGGFCVPYFTKKVRMFETKIPCYSCGKDICRYGHYRCLTETTPAAVIEKANELISEHNII